MTTCDPVDNESPQFLVFVCQSRSECVHDLLLTLKNLSIFCEAKLNMFDKVAGGVGSRVTSDGLPTPGKISASHSN